MNNMNQMPSYWPDSLSNHHQQSIAIGQAHLLQQQLPPLGHLDVSSAGFAGGNPYDYLNKNTHINSTPTAASHTSQVPPHAHSTSNISATISTPAAATPTTRSASKRYMTRNSQNQNNYQPHYQAPLPQKPQVQPEPVQNVAFRPLPFYDQVCEIIAPTVLRSDGIVGRPNESQIEFKLTVDMADLVAMSRETTNIILRFCNIDITSSKQDDNFPPDIVINVNGRQILLPPAISNPNRPNVPAKRPGQHVDITRECKLCPFTHNNVNVKWFVDPTDLMKQYACTMIIGEKQTTDTLLRRIRMKGYSDPTTTMKIIADSDTEVATTNLQCSLLCPLGKMRMTAPCKSMKCQHIPCFDASIYLQMNEKKATWICPICYKPAYFLDLIIDGFFTNILENTSSSITEVTLNLDGTWNPVLKMEQPTSANSKMVNNGPEVITISDDDD